MNYLFQFFRRQGLRHTTVRWARRTASLVLVTATVLNSLYGQGSLWVTAYYAGWVRDNLPPQSIDYGAVTHIVHFALVPRSDGTLDDAVNGVTAAAASALVSPAHAAGKKVIISVGGWATNGLFRAASAPAIRPKLPTLAWWKCGRTNRQKATTA